MRVIYLTQDGKPLCIILGGSNMIVTPNEPKGAMLVVNPGLAMAVDQSYAEVIKMIEGPRLN